jgi:hypothetical protein
MANVPYHGNKRTLQNEGIKNIWYKGPSAKIWEARGNENNSF